MKRNRILGAVVLATVVFSSYSGSSSANERTTLHIDGTCEEPGDTVRFEIEVHDVALDEATVVWGTGIAELEMGCDPPDDPLCRGITVSCPDCAESDPPGATTITAHVVAPDEATSQWSFFELAYCPGDDSVGTQATLCQLQEDGQDVNAQVAAALFVSGGVVVCRRRRTRGRRAS